MTHIYPTNVKSSRTAPFLVYVFLLSTILCAPACAQSDDSKATWPTPLPVGSVQLAHLFEAVSGKPNKDDINELLRGVLSIERGKESFTLRRSDGATLELPRGSDEGDRMFNCLEKSEKSAKEKLGEPAAAYVRSVNALVVKGDRIELQHTGEPSLDIQLPSDQPYLPVSLKALRLANISMQLADDGSIAKVKGIDESPPLSPLAVSMSMWSLASSGASKMQTETHASLSESKVWCLPLCGGYWVYLRLATSLSRKSTDDVVFNSSSLELPISRRGGRLKS